MKKIIILFTVIFFVFQVKAQLVKDEWGKIIPFTKTEKYKKKIDSVNIKTFIMPKYDNDSLFNKHNKGKKISEITNEYNSGFVLKNKSFNLKKKGTKLKLKEGTLWLYRIEGVTTKGLGVTIRLEQLMEGAYVAIYPGDESNSYFPTRVYTRETLPAYFQKSGSFSRSVDGKSMIIEYFEPENLKTKLPIIIENIVYVFADAIQNFSPTNRNIELKSGAWGDSQYLQCLFDITCDDVTGWASEARSVALLRNVLLLDTDNDGHIDKQRTQKATGFFLNKVNNYENTDNPLLFTAGHLFVTEINGTNYDNYYLNYELFAHVNYYNRKCKVEDLDDKGEILNCSFSRIALGNDYEGRASNPSYSSSEDYAILQASRSIDFLSIYNLEYAGWSKNYDISNTANKGYACIHHPSGDVKKVNVDNDEASSAPYNSFYLNYDVGITEGGSSGAPVFNRTGEVVGWHTGAPGTKSCSYVGHNNINNRTENGRISMLYPVFNSLLDPTRVGESSSTSPRPPTPEELPNHCDNCIPDGDETGIDCGGSCYPCGMLDVLTVKTPMDIAGSAKSRYELFADPDPNTLLALKGGSYSLEAGMNVYLNGGFEVEKGAEFYAGVDAELMTEADRGCQLPCVDLADVFTPNGDGINDYWGFSQAFVESYDLLIWDRNGNIIYSTNNQPVYTNGIIAAWDGAGTVSGAVYYGTLTYSDCFGNNHDEDFFTHVYSNKSAIISANGVDSEKATNATAAAINFKTPELEVYPNPFSEEVVVNYTGNSFPLKVKINDIKGKLLFTKEINNPHQKIKMSRFSPGTYIINAKAGEYNLVQKLIKK